MYAVFARTKKKPRVSYSLNHILRPALNQTSVFTVSPIPDETPHWVKPPSPRSRYGKR